MTEFETKDSGERIEYVSGMRRDIQKGKPRFDLLVTEGQPYQNQFLYRFAQLLARGAEKYGERNWQLASSAEELSRFRASGFRHFMQYMSGEEDEDHAAAVAFNLMAAEYVKWKLENEEIEGLEDVPQVSEEGYTCFVHSDCGNPRECLFSVKGVRPQDGTALSGDD